MKKLIYSLTILLVLVVSSCEKRFEELQINPNISTSVPPDLILNRLMNGLSGGLGGVHPWGSVSRYNQFYARNYQYYGDNQYNWNNGPFEVYQDILKNVDRMEEEAAKGTGSTKTPYHAIGKFLKAYYYYNLTSLMGDVPLSEANKGEEGIFQPKYDNQKAVFLQVLKWLTEATTEFETLKANPNLTLKGDIYYNGNYTKWRKLVNSYKLRVLIALSKKETDADLKIKQQFNEVLSNSASFPIFESDADNFSYRYISGVNNYPTNTNNYGFDALRYNMAQTYIKNGTDLSDPRILVTSEPAWKLVNDNDWAPTDFRAYIGAPTGQNQNDMEANAISYSISHINRYRYYRNYTAEDFVIAGYVEQCFNIAEAINRGWVTGNAEDYYKKGIQASLAFYGIKNGTNTGYYLQIGKKLGDWTTANYNFEFDSYYSQAGVKYEAGAPGLNKILIQKYLSFFQNSGWEAYYNYRRTGVPAFSGGIGVGNNGIIPKRWTYPAGEINRNGINLKAALTRQFSGSDNINSEMWLIK
ncbi:MAG: SusD/RagB family nutrient-binding outer membrane lipoprotein [Daejeonella sp.]